MKAKRRSSSAWACLVLALTTLHCSRSSDSPPQSPEPEAPAKPPRGEDQDDDEKIVVTGLSTPESVVHDVFADVYLVSNIAGELTAKDGNGFISKIAPNGEILELRFIDGSQDGVELHAPKGIALASDGLIVVTDIDTVRYFDRDTGAPREQIPVPGATFLNDVAPFDDASVIVTDSGLEMKDGQLSPSGTDAVYQVTRSGDVIPLLQDEGLGSPNGVAVLDNGALRVVTFGSGEIFDIQNGKQSVYDTQTPGQLDGLVVIDDRTIWTSSWQAQQILRWQDNEWSVVLGELHSPADFSVDRARSRVLIPLFMENELWIVPLVLD